MQIDFKDESELPKGCVVGWAAAVEASGYSKHFVMRHFYMGEFPRPIGRVKVFYRKKGNPRNGHWNFVWVQSEIKKWVVLLSLRGK